MNATKRPVSVWILSCLYIAVGTIAFAYYFPELRAHHDGSVWIEFTELLAIVSGAFMFRETTGHVGSRLFGWPST